MTWTGTQRFPALGWSWLGKVDNNDILVQYETTISSIFSPFSKQLHSWPMALDYKIELAANFVLSTAASAGMTMGSARSSAREPLLHVGYSLPE